MKGTGSGECWQDLSSQICAHSGQVYCGVHFMMYVNQNLMLYTFSLYSVNYFSIKVGRRVYMVVEDPEIKSLKNPHCLCTCQEVLMMRFCGACTSV